VADTIGLSDVSSKDTGKGKILKTGNSRSYNMANKNKDNPLVKNRNKRISKLKKCKANATTERDSLECVRLYGNIFDPVESKQDSVKAKKKPSKEK